MIGVEVHQIISAGRSTEASYTSLAVALLPSIEDYVKFGSITLHARIRFLNNLQRMRERCKQLATRASMTHAIQDSIVMITYSVNMINAILLHVMS
jgi:hypothetical protein